MFSFPHCRNAIKRKHEPNNIQHDLHCTADNSKWTGTGLCQHAFRSTGIKSKYSLKLKCGLQELRTMMRVVTAEKLSVTIDKGQNSGHFWEIKEFPPDATLKPVKEDMSGKTWM
jgi:hypothetical protein